LCRPALLAARSVEVKAADETVSEAKRGLLNKIKGKLSDDEDGEPAEGKDGEKPER
jgi:hypothetical protein